MKMLQGWKTFALGLLTAVVAALEGFDITDLVNEQNEWAAMTVLAVLVMFLRALTRSPIFEKEPEE